MATEVFISYRRETGQNCARLIEMFLKGKGYSVFFDQSSIRGGKYGEKIIKAIEECKFFIIILSPNSLDRCAEKGDVMTKEIKKALERSRDIDIIPVTINTDKFNGPSNLSKEIAPIFQYQFHQYRDDKYFDAAMDELLKRLQTTSRSTTNENDEYEDEYNMAMEYDSAGEEKNALPIFMKLATKGHAKSQEMLGCYYELGIAGLSKNLDKACEWYMKAAEQGNLEALIDLGDLYCYSKDDYYFHPETGISYYQEAMDQKYFDGYSSIAYCYMQGIYYEKDDQKALDYFCKAFDLAPKSEKGNIATLIGHLYDKQGLYKEAHTYYMQAYECGCTESISSIGWDYILGQGVECNEEIGVKYFEEGVRKNDTRSMYGLADHLYDIDDYSPGNEITPNMTRAFQLLKKASELGNTGATDDLCYFCKKDGPFPDKELLGKCLETMNKKGLDIDEDLLKEI